MLLIILMQKHSIKTERVSWIFVTKYNKRESRSAAGRTRALLDSHKPPLLGQDEQHSPIPGHGVFHSHHNFPFITMSICHHYFALMCNPNYEFRQTAEVFIQFSYYINNPFWRARFVRGPQGRLSNTQS